MAQFESLVTDDYTDRIAKLPKQRGYSVLPPRVDVQYVTFHYSAVAYPTLGPTVERQRIIDEAKYQVAKNWGSPGDPAYGDGIMYDCVVLSTGEIIRTRHNQQLWHCGNKTGNRNSFAVHVMLGGTQDVTEAQRAAVYRIFDAVRSDSNLPRQNIIAHCEWPRNDGLPVRSPIYRVIAPQSACPGPVLFPLIVRYRGAVIAPPAPIGVYRVVATAGVDVYEGPACSFPIAWQGKAHLVTGTLVEVDGDKDGGWKHLKSGIGFVQANGLQAQ